MTGCGFVKMLEQPDHILKVKGRLAVQLVDNVACYKMEPILENFGIRYSRPEEHCRCTTLGAGITREMKTLCCSPPVLVFTSTTEVRQVWFLAKRCWQSLDFVWYVELTTRCQVSLCSSDCFFWQFAFTGTSSKSSATPLGGIVTLYEVVPVEANRKD